MKMKIKIINKSKHPLPSYSTEASAGMDIRADIRLRDNFKSGRKSSGEQQDYFLRFLIGYEAQIRPQKRIGNQQRNNSS